MLGYYYSEGDAVIAGIGCIIEGLRAMPGWGIRWELGVILMRGLGCGRWGLPLLQRGASENGAQ